MKSKAFDRSEHVYKNDAFAELVKDAVRFFNGTPVHTLPPPEAFLGTGVYAIYYTGKNPAYKKYAELNRLSYDSPIYVARLRPRAGDKRGFPTISSINPKGYLITCGNTDEASVSLKDWNFKTSCAGSLFLRAPVQTSLAPSKPLLSN